MKICDKEIRIRGRLVRIAGLDADTYEFFDDPERAVQEARTAGARIDVFTFMQRLPETTPRFRYPMEWDNLAAIPVSTFEHWWNEQIGFKARNKAKQAGKKGVTLREASFDDAFVRGVWEIYNESPVRQGKPFAHYGKDLETVRKEAGTFADRSFYIGAFLGDQLIGFVKLICDETRTQAGLVHIVSMNQHRDKAPTNALVAEAVKLCASKKIPYLVYSRYLDGNKQGDSLLDFKERNGFQKFDLPRYYVPLTLAGGLALRMGLHHRLADRLPEPLIAKLRKVRNAWYNRKFEAATETS